MFHVKQRVGQMITLQPLAQLDDQLLRALIVGYTTTEQYHVSKAETPDAIRFELRLLPLEQPFTKRYPPIAAEELQHYQSLAAQGHAFGAFAQGHCVGIAVTEPRLWNASLWVLDFHIAASHQRAGLGRLLMEQVAAHARANSLHCIVCETQSKNVPAIRFYRSQGFVLDGVDLSFYSEHDQELGEVAVFLKKWLV
jgi:ribosomal protein S18 acetylase RimI-like enzyme